MKRRRKERIKRITAMLLVLAMVLTLVPEGLLMPMVTRAAGNIYTVANWDPYDEDTNSNGWPSTLEDGDTLILNVDEPRTSGSGAIRITAVADASVTIIQNADINYNNIYFSFAGNNTATIRDLRIIGTQAAYPIINFEAGTNSFVFDGTNILTQHRTTQANNQQPVVSVNAGITVNFDGTAEGVLRAEQTAAGVNSWAAAIGTAGRYATSNSSEYNVVMPASGQIIINSGTIRAVGLNGAGIGVGGGYSVMSRTSGQNVAGVVFTGGSPHVEIKGGNVTAISDAGAGIGSGHLRTENTITGNGGNVSNFRGLANFGAPFITITGGSIYGGSSYGAGVGIGYAIGVTGNTGSLATSNSSGAMAATGEFVIRGGELTAVSQFGDGIGAGVHRRGYSGSTTLGPMLLPMNITINSGTIDAENQERYLNNTTTNPSGIGGASILIEETFAASQGLHAIVKAEGTANDIKASNIVIRGGNIELASGPTAYNIVPNNGYGANLSLFKGELYEFSESINNDQYTYTAVCDDNDMIYVWLPPSTGLNALRYDQYLPRGAGAYVDTLLTIYGNKGLQPVDDSSLSAGEKELTVFKQDGTEIFRLDFSDTTAVANHVTVDPNVNTKAYIELPEDALDPSTTYYVLADEGIFTDILGYFNYAAITGSTTWSFTTGTGKRPIIVPAVSATFDPEPGDTGVALDPTLTITFAENSSNSGTFADNLRLSNSGQIEIKTYYGLETVETISTGDSDKVWIDGKSVVIQPSKILERNTRYCVFISEGAIFNDDSTANEAYEGIEYRGAWYFTTGGQQVLSLNYFLPDNGATNVYRNTSLTAIFNEPIALEEGKSINLYKVGDSTPTVITHTDFNSPMSTTGSVLTVDPGILDADTVYYVLVEEGLVTSANGARAWSGISSPNAWRFQTNDQTALYHRSLSPTIGATSASTTARPAITFYEPVRGVSGKYISVWGETVGFHESVDATTATMSGNTATISLTEELDTDETYFITVDAGAFVDAATGDLQYVGVEDGDWYFTTRSTSSGGNNGGDDNNNGGGGPGTTPLVSITGPGQVDVPLKSAGAASVYEYEAWAYRGTTQVEDPEFYWQIEGQRPAGITIDSDTGELSVAYTAQSGYVNISATWEGIVGEKNVYVNREAEVVSTTPRIEGVPAIQIPGSGASTEDYLLKQADAEENDTILRTVVWSLAQTISGVSLAQSNGQLTLRVASTASEGVITLQALNTATGVTYTQNVLLYKAPAVLTSIELEGPAGIDIPATGDENRVAYTAKAYDQYGLELSGESFTYTIDPDPTTGVHIIPDTGVVWVNETAQDSESFQVIATLDSDSSYTKDLTVTLSGSKVNETAARLAIMANEDTFAVPEYGELTEYQYEAKLYNQYGQEMTTDTSNIRWKLEGTIPGGVSLGYLDGKLIVYPEASTGSIVVTAELGALSDSIAATIYRPSPILTNVVIESGPHSLERPESGTNTGAFAAKAYDQYGSELTSASISYSVEGNVAGASFANQVLSISPSITVDEVQVIATARLGTATVDSDVWAVGITEPSGSGASYSIGGDGWILVPSSDTPTSKTYTYYRGRTTVDNVLWQIDGNAPQGVTLDLLSGKLTVDKTAQTGSVTITAIPSEAGYPTLSRTVLIQRNTSVPTSLTVQGSNLVDIPPNASYGDTKTAYSAVVYDQYGVALSGAEIVWSIDGIDAANSPYVSLDADTGLLTVRYGATRQSGNLTVTATSKTNNSVSGSQNVTLRDVTSDVAARIGITGNTDVTVPSGSTPAHETYIATVYDHSGKELSGAATIRIQGELPEGLTFVDNNDGTGSLGVSRSAKSATIIIVAEYDGLSQTQVVKISRATSTVVNASDITVSGPSLITVTAQPGEGQYQVEVLDQYGDPFAPDSIQWSVDNAPAGITIDAATGLVYVLPTVKASTFTVRAMVNGDLSNTKQVTIYNTGEGGGSTTGGTIRVTVRDEDRSGISGATVDNGQEALITDENGQVSFIGLDSGTYLLLANHDAYNTNSSRVGVTESGSVNVVITLTANSSNGGTDLFAITGTTYDEQGITLNGVTAATREISALSDDQGRYALTGLEAGSYPLLFSKNGYQSDYVEGLIFNQDAEVEAFLKAMPEIATGSGTLYGQITSALTGKPIAGATVSTDNAETVTDANGNYLFTNISPGSYTLTVSAAGYLPISTAATVIGNNHTLRNLVLQPSGGKLNVSVVDADSQSPISGAKVTGQFGSETTDDSGVVSFTQVAAGLQLVQAEAAGYNLNAAYARMADDETTELTIALHKDSSNGGTDLYYISGVVRDNGARLSDVDITATIDGRKETLTTDMHGAYLVSGGLVDGSFVSLAFRKDGYESVSRQQTIASRDVVLDVNLNKLPVPTGEQGILYGLVSDAVDGSALDGAVIQITNNLNQTTVQGLYLFEELTPGSYTVVITASGYNTSVGLAVVSEGSQTNYNAELTRSSDHNNGGGSDEFIITGTVVSSTDGAPIGGAEIQAEGLTAYTDQTGRYGIGPVTEGAVAVRVTATGYLADDANVTVSGSDAEQDFILIPSDSGGEGASHLYVTVQTEDGTPIRNAAVTLGTTSKETNNSGLVVFTHLAADTYLVSASHEEYNTNYELVTMTDDETKTITIVLTPNKDHGTNPGENLFSVSGVVQDENGNPLANVSVEQLDGETTVSIDSQGHFMIANLADGSNVSLQFNKEGYYSAYRTYTSISADVTGQVVELAAVGTPGSGLGTVYGLVIDAETKEAIVGSAVQLNGKTATTDSRGHYTFANLEPADYLVIANASGYNTSALTVTVMANQAVSTDLELSRDSSDNGGNGGEPGTDSYVITGRVTAAGSEEGLSGAIVTDETNSVTTDSFGYYLIGNYENEEPVTLQVDATDYARASRTVVIDGADATENFVLKKIGGGGAGDDGTGSIQVTVEDEDGNCIAGATVDIGSTEDFTNGLGQVTFTDLNGGTYLVVANHNEYNTNYAKVELKADTAANITIVLTPNGSHTTNPGATTYSIRGVVQDENNEPLEAVVVTLLDSESSMVTNAQGQFVIIDLAAGANATLYFSKEDYESVYETYTNLAGDVTDQVITMGSVDAPEIDKSTIYGIVTDAETSEPITGAEVQLNGQFETTSSDGRYRFENVQPATYLVIASASGYNTSAATITMEAGQTASADLRLGRDSSDNGGNGGEPGTDAYVITGRITKANDGYAISGAAVTDGLTSVMTDNFGYYLIGSYEAGDSVTLTASANGYISKDDTVAVTGDETQDFALKVEGSGGDEDNGTGSILVTVTEEDGTAISGAMVEIGTADDITDSFGQVIFTDLNGGSYLVLASHDEYNTNFDKVVLAADTAESITIVLTPNSDNTGNPGFTTYSISGVVQDDSSVALADVSVAVVGSNSGMLTDSLGRFAVTNLAEGSDVALYFSKAGYESVYEIYADIDTDLNDEVIVMAKVEMPDSGKSTVYGIVTDDETSEPIFGAEVQLNGQTETTDINGRYSFDNVAPATYLMVAKADGYNTGSVTVAAEADQAVNADIALNRDSSDNGGNGGEPGIDAYVITGQVTKQSDGEPISGATIADGVTTVTTDSFGYYLIGSYETGDSVTLEASASGYDPKRSTVIITSDETQNFALSVEGSGGDGDNGTGSIQVTVEDENGTAIAGATVDIGSTKETTNSAGQATITNLMGNTYLLVATHNEYNTNYGVVELAADTAESITIVLTPNSDNTENPGPTTYSISGVVQDDSYVALKDVSVMVAGSDHSMLTDSQGRFAVANLAKGSDATLYFSKDGYHSAYEIYVGMGADLRDEVIVMSKVDAPETGKSTVYGLVTDAETNEPITSATVQLNGQTKTTDTNGRYSFDNVEPATYLVIAKADAYNTGSVTVVAKADQAVNADMALNRDSSDNSGNGGEPGTDAYIITGQVTKADGDGAISNATISDGLTSVTTDSFGYYLIGSYETGDSVTLEASASGYDPKRSTVTITSDETQNFALSVEGSGGDEDNGTGSIEVTVTEEDGTPIPDASIDIGSAKDITDSSGQVTFTNLEGGSYLVLATHDKYNTNYDIVELAADTAESITIVLTPNSDNTGNPGHTTYSISGVVQDDSNVALAGVRVAIAGSESSMLTDSQGRFAVTNLTKGSDVTLYFSKDGYHSAYEIYADINVDLEDEVIVMTKVAAPNSGKGTVYGIVTDAETNEPIVGAEVRLNGETEITGIDGRYSFADVDPATYLVIGSATGYNSGATTVTVEADKAASADIRLNRDNSNNGGNGGEPGTDAYIITGQVTEADSSEGIQSVAITDGTVAVETDSFGYYFIGTYKAGTDLTLRYSKDGYHSIYEYYEIESADLLNQDVSMTKVTTPDSGKSTVYGLVTDAETNEPITGATVQLNGQTEITDPNGRYSFDNVDPATYLLIAKADGYNTGSITVTASANQAANGDLALNRDSSDNGGNGGEPGMDAYVITGQVTNHDDSEAISGATVTDGFTSVTTDSFGYYLIGSYEVGDSVTLEASANGYESKSGIVTIARDETQNFALSAKGSGGDEGNGSILVTVTDEAGTPIADATVDIGSAKDITNSAGQAKFTSLASNTYLILVTHDKYNTNYDVVALAADTAETITIVMTPNNNNTENPGPTTYSISGAVEDDRHAPMADVRVNEVGSDSDMMTDSQGRFAVVNLAEGTDVALYFSKDGYDSVYVTYTAINSDLSDEVITMTKVDAPDRDKSTVYGIVTDAETSGPVSGATVQLNGQTETTDSNGRYYFDNVEPATYLVIAKADGYNTGSLTVTVAANGTANADITLNRDSSDNGGNGGEPGLDAYVITGQVTKQDGSEAIHDATVTDGTTSVITDSFGYYLIGDYEDRTTVSLTALATGYESKTETMVINGQDEAQNFALTEDNGEGPQPPDPNTDHKLVIEGASSIRIPEPAEEPNKLQLTAIAYENGAEYPGAEITWEIRQLISSPIPGVSITADGELQISHQAKQTTVLVEAGWKDADVTATKLIALLGSDSDGKYLLIDGVTEVEADSQTTVERMYYALMHDELEPGQDGRLVSATFTIDGEDSDNVTIDATSGLLKVGSKAKEGYYTIKATYIAERVKSGDELMEPEADENLEHDLGELNLDPDEVLNETEEPAPGFAEEDVDDLHNDDTGEEPAESQTQNDQNGQADHDLSTNEKESGQTAEDAAATATPRRSLTGFAARVGRAMADETDEFLIQPTSDEVEYVTYEAELIIWIKAAEDDGNTDGPNPGGPGGGGSGGGGGGGSTTTTTDEDNNSSQADPTLPGTTDDTEYLALDNDVLRYLNGYPDGTIRPDASITRAETAVIFHQLVLDANKDASRAWPFKDNGEGWYATAVAYLTEKGVLTGYPDATYRPNNEITRAEFAVIVSRFSAITDAEAKFQDLSSEHWAYRYIASTVGKGYLSGYPDGTFRPDAFITRAEVVTVVNQMLGWSLSPAAGADDSRVSSFTDLADSHWARYQILDASLGRSAAEADGIVVDAGTDAGADAATGDEAMPDTDADEEGTTE